MSLRAGLGLWPMSLHAVPGRRPMPVGLCRLTSYKDVGLCRCPSAYVAARRARVAYVAGLALGLPLSVPDSEPVAVRRPRKAPEGAIPSPSPTRHTVTLSRRGSSWSGPPTADGFGTGTPGPSPQGYLIRQNSHASSSYPKGNFGGNQLLHGSISLSPLYPSQTIDLHVNIAAGLHRVSSGFAPLGHSSPSFGSRQYAHTRTLLEDQGRSAVHPGGIPPIASLRLTGLLAH
ncbi:hypothetical protein RND71_023361 [Anisodus tanguticus]|uniref:Uncharacterized protein n=1 Tax=Anisodus tanguticus TaxID=243964 RepID=A0AAE1RTR7_9SOLA|nr:hypothetical protein RND71_023361 [Anisodus tanguticus]